MLPALLSWTEIAKPEVSSHFGLEDMTAFLNLLRPA
jgi:hypothetical protein